MTPGLWRAYGTVVVDENNEVLANTSALHLTHPEEQHNAQVIARLPELITAVRMFVRNHEQIPAVPVDPYIGIGPEAGGCVCAYCSRFKPFLAVVDQP